LSTYATDLRLEIEPTNGAHVTKVVSNVEHEKDVTGSIEIPISNILAEETQHLVFATKTIKKDKVFPRDTTIFDIRLSYDVLTEDGSKQTKTAEAKAKVRFVRTKEAQDKPCVEVDRLVALHQTIRAQLEAEKAADKGDFAQAAQVMQLIADDVQQRGHENIARVAYTTGGRVASAAMYVQNTGYLRSFANAGTRAYGTSALHAEAAQELASCDVSLSNSAMHQYQQEFAITTGDSVGGSVGVPVSDPLPIAQIAKLPDPT
jgi:hypothetical protein